MGGVNPRRAPPLQCHGTGGSFNDSLFINNERLFIAEAKKASTIRIESVVYQNGTPVFEFDTAGLKWK
jgi:hypothetical protein